MKVFWFEYLIWIFMIIRFTIWSSTPSFRQQNTQFKINSIIHGTRTFGRHSCLSVKCLTVKHPAQMSVSQTSDNDGWRQLHGTWVHMRFRRTKSKISVHLPLNKHPCTVKLKILFRNQLRAAIFYEWKHFVTRTIHSPILSILNPGRFVR